MLSLPGGGFAEVAPGPPVLPTPHYARFQDASLDLGKGVEIVVPAHLPRLKEIAEILRQGLEENGIIGAVTTFVVAPDRYHVVIEKKGGIPASIPEAPRADAPSSSDRPRNGSVSISLSLAPPSAGAGANPEGYAVRIGDSIEVTAADARGLLWGVQTLLQCIEPIDQVESTGRAGPPGPRPNRNQFIRKGVIIDAPDRAWRALMLDPARSFLDLDFLRRTLRVMSAYKLNILNLHLIDDQAWRFETKWYPRCNRPGEPLYTQQQLRELVAFARRYGVEIIPEIDFPGHVMTAVAAYPELDCEGKARSLNQAILCPGKPFSWIFMDRVIAEVVDTFPSLYLEIGADEPFAMEKRWGNCPACRERMRLKGVSTLPAFYHTVVTDIDEIVKRHGKTMIACNDAITPGVDPMPPQDIVINGWVDYNVVEPLAEAGYAIINSTNHPLYLTSLGLRAGNPLSTVYAWNATLFAPPGIRREAQVIDYKPLAANARILGGQVSAWATEQRLAERRLYPRTLAVAEALWSEKNRGNFAQFEARLRAGHMARLRRMGVPDDLALPVDKLSRRNGLREEAHRWISLKRYRDFIFTCEQRGRRASPQAGVWIRCKPGPAGGESGGFPIYTVPPNGLICSDKFYLPGKWNRFEITARGSIVSLTINDGLAWSQVDPNSPEGTIVLDDSKDVDFRNILVRPLTPPP